MDCMTITVSTDGSALGNPNGPMGWAWADHNPDSDNQSEHSHPGDCDAGGATNGTNQIGELCAVLEALRTHPGNEPLVIETDSQYAINCSTTWVHGWKRNGWKNSQKKPVKNAELIKAIDAELSKRPGSVRFVWVKGHAGNAGNEKVDQLARTYASDCRSGACEGYLPREGWQSLLSSEYSSGLDIPSDAQLLLDGAVDDADYHRGRSNSSSALENSNRIGNGNTVADDDDQDEGSGQTTVMPTSRKPALAALVAEPEGVPDYPFSHSDNESSIETPNSDADSDVSATTVLPIGTFDDGELNNGNAAYDTDSLDDINIGGSTAEDTAGESTTTVIPCPRLGGMRRPGTSVNEDNTTEGETTLITTSDTDDTDSDTNADTAGDNDSSDNSIDSSTAGETVALETTPDDSETATIVTSVSDNQHTDSDCTPTPTTTSTTQPRSSSGLTVSGTVRFTPPPQSSPTYDGHPRFIRGTITVEGYVQGDGTIVLDEAPFTVHRA